MNGDESSVVNKTTNCVFEIQLHWKAKKPGEHKHHKTIIIETKYCAWTSNLLRCQARVHWLKWFVFFDLLTLSRNFITKCCHEAPTVLFPVLFLFDGSSHLKLLFLGWDQWETLRFYNSSLHENIFFKIYINYCNKFTTAEETLATVEINSCEIKWSCGQNSDALLLMHA